MHLQLTLPLQPQPHPLSRPKVESPLSFQTYMNLIGRQICLADRESALAIKLDSEDVGPGQGF